MDDKKQNYKYDLYNEEEHVYHVFGFILFLITFWFILFGILFVAYVCDYFGWGPSALPNGWTNNCLDPYISNG